MSGVAARSVRIGPSQTRLGVKLKYVFSATSSRCLSARASFEGVRGPVLSFLSPLLLRLSFTPATWLDFYKLLQFYFSLRHNANAAFARPAGRHAGLALGTQGALRA